MKMVPQQYCLRWKHHHTNVQNMFAQLLEKERFCDVTLYCSPSFATQVPEKGVVEAQNIRGVSLRAHRVVLAACSELLGALLGAHESQGEPVLVIDGAEPRHLKALLDYMYTGEMNVHHSQLASLLKTAEELRIKGLTDIRWNNKDEPPDCRTGAVTTTTSAKKTPEQKADRKRAPSVPLADPLSLEREELKRESEASDSERLAEKINNVNGGPPPLIKLPVRQDKAHLHPKRDHSDTESPSPKRRRMPSATEHTDDEDREAEWQHGNMDISAERVVGWCAGVGAEADPEGEGEGERGAASWERDASDEEWADAPADIGSFLHTRLRVDGDNSADEESNEGAPPSTSSSAGASAVDPKEGPTKSTVATIGPKSGPSDPRFTDVVKLNDYLKHGRRPQFWEENYVKRVMEAVRIKELEMKQAAEILGVSYGTLYGRYRDVFGCINRPYRTARDFWQAKGPAEILDRLQRGELSLDAGAIALGVSPNNLAAYMSDATTLLSDKEFEPIPIDIDPTLKKLTQAFSGAVPASLVKMVRKAQEKGQTSKKVSVSNVNDEEFIPASVIATYEGKKPAVTATTTAPTPSGKWPAIRVASIDSLRGSDSVARAASASPSPSHSSAPSPARSTSPSHLMRTRPDLTIVAAKKTDFKKEDETT